MGENRIADVVIIGGGVMGCSTAYNLVKQGARNVVVVERKHVCSGGTAKSCAVVRTHYSIPANLVHAVKSLEIFANFQVVVGGDAGFRRTGYIILGPEAHREPMEAVFRTQNEYGIDTTVLTPAEALEIHPLMRYDDVGVIGYDTQAGYCDPHLTTAAYAQRAKDLGATICTDAPVTDLQINGSVKTVETPAGVVLVGTGDHGDPIEDADTLTDHVDSDHVARMDALISHRMPAFADSKYVAGWTGPYDITPDWNPIVGAVPTMDGLYVAVGFSGHGFKLAPTIGEALAQTVLGQTPRVSIDMYGMARFSAGKVLHGAYGIGSIA